MSASEGAGTYFFHLVENKEEDYPFAFLATYATKDTNDKVRHMPLAYALTEYQEDRGKLLQLLSCLNRASEVSTLIEEFVEKGELFHLLRLTADEAQAIKNPLTEQTKCVKALHSKMRIAMTGTPIENDLTNLWSLFDFLNKGLLGSSTEFHDYCKRLADNPEGYAKLKAMIAPFLLRRVKTDKAIISDLPDNLEQIDYVGLSKKQTVLYRKYVAELAEKLDKPDGMKRRGLVLASLTKLKQICNHPDQYLGQTVYDPKESGMFEMLREVCETIYQKRESVLVFTQFKEITGYLDGFLADIFGCHGHVLHGGNPVAKRNKNQPFVRGTLPESN